MPKYTLLFRDRLEILERWLQQEPMDKLQTGFQSMKNTAEALSGALGIYQSVLEPYKYKLPDTI